MRHILKRIISDFHHRPYPEMTFRHKNIEINLEKIVAIIGPRRAGKTYMLFQLMKELEHQGVPKHQILYINFEDERLELEGHYDVILEAYFELYPEAEISQCYFFFDEIQELHQWEKFVRRIYDTQTKHIFITGSNAGFLSKEIASSLRGRAISYEIMPLSFKEFLQFKHIDMSDRSSIRNASMVNRAYEDYILWGGYPELVNVDSHLKIKILHEYFNVMIYRDLIEIYGIRDVSMLKYQIKRMISSFTKEFSINKLYNDFKSQGIAISKNLIYQTTERIFSIYMMACVEKYDPSVIKREISNKKIYLYDNGFASVSNYIFFEDRGKLLENMVFSNLRHFTEEIFFLKNGWECDFLAFISSKNSVLIQVTECLDSDTVGRELKGLEQARKRISASECLILTEKISAGIQLPEWVKATSVCDWLLDDEV
ncbi:MAG: ATP-binding protein [Desulfobacterales bacterium]|nr:ATP-binding protein [Desulfobacterales bacterium]